jgi:hypothetical protein
MTPRSTLLRSSKLRELPIDPGKLPWPWIAFSPERTAFALPVSRTTLALRSEASLDRELRLELPDALSIPTVAADPLDTTSRQRGVHAIAVHPDGQTAVAFGWSGGLPVACVRRAGTDPELVDLGPAFGDMGPMAATFTRSGESLWVSAESAAGAAIARLRFRDFVLEAKVAFAPAPPPAAHELYLHPLEDAVLLTMACGQDGTFVRVARFADGRLELVASQRGTTGPGDGALDPCGTAEATEDGTRICLVASDHVELRRWPDLSLEASVALGDERSANYNGVRMGGRFVVSATVEDDEGEDERALLFSEALVLEDDAPAPPGMWAGRLGRDRLVTIGREENGARMAYVHGVRI